MSVQDNKFPIVLGAVTAVAVGGFLWWGMKSKGAYEEAKTGYEEAVSKVKSLTGASIYPNRENLQDKERNVGDYQTEVGEMEDAFDSFRKTQLDNVAAGDFTDKLRKAKEEVVAAFKQANPEVEIPPEFFIGLNKFTTEPPSQNITGVLGFQMDAIKQLMMLLAQAKPSKLNNVHRPPLPEESGKQVDLGGQSYRVHPVEVSFTGREETLRDFVSALDDQKEFYYVIRSLRLKNERQKPPHASDARFEQPKPAATATDPFAGGGFVFPDENDAGTEEEAPAEGEEAPAGEEAEAPADSGEILKQVLGSEKVQVFLRIDILQYLDPKPLPER